MSKRDKKRHDQFITKMKMITALAAVVKVVLELALWLLKQLGK